MAGSTNTRQFIPFDRTGARRFLPIAIDSSKAEKHILDDEKEARAYFEQLWAEAMEIYWSTENKNSLLKFSKEMEQEISEYRKQFTQEDTMAGMIQGWLDAYKGTHVCSAQIWKGAFNRCQQKHSKNFSIVFWKIKKRPVKSFKPHVDTYVVSVPINFRQRQRQSSLCRAQERKEIDDYGENDEYKRRKKHIYKEDRADSIYCSLLFQRRGKGNHVGKD